jgi:Flp pilus assembly pilin Flp
MKTLLRSIVRFVAGEEGTTAVGYAAMILVVLLACLSLIVFLGQSSVGTIVR